MLIIFYSERMCQTRTVKAEYFFLQKTNYSTKSQMAVVLVVLIVCMGCQLGNRRNITIYLPYHFFHSLYILFKLLKSFDSLFFNMETERISRFKEFRI